MKSDYRGKFKVLAFFSALIGATLSIFIYGYFAGAISIIEIVGYVAAFCGLLFFVVFIVRLARKDELRYFSMK